MMNIKYSFYCLTILAILTCSVSCDSVLSRKDTYVIIYPKIEWNPVNPNKDAIYIDSEFDTTLNQFVFKVDGVNSESGIDTMKISKRDIEKGGRKTIRTETGLYMKKPLTVNQIESLLKLHGISDHSLKEKLYWMCKLTYAHVKVSKNNYGDIIGYNAISGNDYIPNEYYSILTKSMEISPNDVNLGRREHDGNYIRYYLTICNPILLASEINDIDSSSSENNGLPISSNYNDLRIDFLCGVLNNLTPIDFTNKELSVAPAPSHKIYFCVWVSGNLYISNHNGELFYETYPDYFPFSYHTENIKRSK
jgi:hypothetical protein